MIYDEVHDQLQVSLVQTGDQVIDVVHSTVPWIDSSVISNIIAHVDQGAFVDGADPNNIDTKCLDVVEFLDDARYVADTIAIGVIKGAGVDLVD